MTPLFKTARLWAPALLLSLAAAGSQARIIATAWYSQNFMFTTPTALVPLWGSAGETQIDFDAPKAGRYVLTFTAECAVSAPLGQVAYIDIDVLVNGMAAPPTAGFGDTFCTTNATPAMDGWNRQSITIAVNLKKGNNTISVLGRLDNGATGGWLSDSTLAVLQ